MLHGWMDVSASFQFVVDNFANNWHVIAPDWRGFGLTERVQSDCYWFADYLGDLEAILDHYAHDQAVNLIGHSMGGNVAGIYAGVRPERVAKLVNLEGFGLAATEPAMAPARYAQWLDELREPPTMRAYETIEGVISRLMKTNPRLARDRAEFLAAHWSAQNAHGQWEILGDPAHKITSATLYRVEEVIACWEKITAPVLWVEANDSDLWRWMGGRDKVRAELDRRRACIPNVKSAVVNDAGHMLHHDQPELLARLIEDFLV
ncbi:MAG: alpha/beta hydrolase [Sulfuritalea sp.]|nr:alpha/beta hydrolase [Polynucleobacter sp.]MCF8188004.1 alpha/beta hydrolase [Sulfuritalea sp.]